MRCTICGQAEPRAGTTTVTVERDGATLVMKGAPALICSNCGEDFVSEETARGISAAAAEVVAKGVSVEVRQYAASNLTGTKDYGPDAPSVRLMQR